MVPSESLAFALMVMFAGAVNTALFAGLVMLTAGGEFEGSSVATNLLPAKTYSLTTVGDARGGGSAGAVTSLTRAWVVFEESSLAAMAPTSEKQRITEKTMRANRFRSVLDLMFARRFKVDIGILFLSVGRCQLKIYQR
jgi:hypothetical protein